MSFKLSKIIDLNNEEEPIEPRDESSNDNDVPEKTIEEKRKSSGIYLTVFIVLILVIFASVFFYTKFLNKPLTIDELHLKNMQGKETENNYMYNGFSFVKYDNLWYTQLQSGDTIYDVSLRFGPKEIENVPIKVNLNGINREIFPELFITIDPYTNDATYETLAAAELSLNLVRALGIIPKAACNRQDNNTCLNRDIIDCSYDKVPVIYIKESDNVKVTQENLCIVIEGKGIDLLKSVDRLIYSLYGII